MYQSFYHEQLFEKKNYFHPRGWATEISKRSNILEKEKEKKKLIACVWKQDSGHICDEILTYNMLPHEIGKDAYLEIFRKGKTNSIKCFTCSLKDYSNNIFF